MARHYCFTLNNYEDALDPNEWLHMRYCVYSEEIGEEGTPHLQGYVEFDAPMTMAQVHLLDGMEKSALRERRGTRDQARDYCMKMDETFLDGPYEYGRWTLTPGKREDLNALYSDIKKGATMMDLAENHLGAFVKYQRGIQALMELRPVKPRESMKVILCVGLTETGKSHYCRDKAPQAYMKPKKAQWYPKYNGQKELILDDFYGSMPWTDLLTLLDVGGYQVETKGGYTDMLAETIYITSNAHPKHWYSKMLTENPHMDPNALYRRFNVILYFYAKYEEPTVCRTLDELDALHSPVSGRRPDTSTPRVPQVHTPMMFDPNNNNRIRARTHMDDVLRPTNYEVDNFNPYPIRFVNYNKN